MSNREALRELQSRLANRLQAAQSGEQVASWLGTRVGTRQLLVPLAQAGEIFPWAPPVFIPYAKPWFLGLTNLRGGVFGTVDLAVYLGAPARQGPLIETARSQARLLTFNGLLDLNAALLIDELLGLRQSTQFASSEPPLPGDPDCLGARLITPDGDTWQELRLQQLAHSGPFLSIATEPTRASPAAAHEHAA